MTHLHYNSSIIQERIWSCSRNWIRFLLEYPGSVQSYAVIRRSKLYLEYHLLSFSETIFKPVSILFGCICFEWLLLIGRIFNAICHWFEAISEGRTVSETEVIKEDWITCLVCVFYLLSFYASLNELNNFSESTTHFIMVGFDTIPFLSSMFVLIWWKFWKRNNLILS